MAKKPNTAAAAVGSGAGGNGVGGCEHGGGGMRVETWALDRIKPYPGNPRVTEDAVAPVAESIKRFGFRQPIVVDADGVIVAGHVRHAAARLLGLAEAPVHVAADLSPAAAKAYRIADNKTGERAEWDLARLAGEIAIPDLAVDWGRLGFSKGELKKLDALTTADDTEGGGDGGNGGTLHRELVLSFDDEAAMRACFERLTAEGLSVRALSYYK